jgi:hypothetical protein
VYPARARIDELGQGVDICALQLGERPVGDEVIDNGVMPLQRLQNVYVRGKAGLGLSDGLEPQLSKSTPQAPWWS